MSYTGKTPAFNTLDVSDVRVESDVIYFGDKDTNGSKRIFNTGSVLRFEERVGGVWIPFVAAGTSPVIVFDSDVMDANGSATLEGLAYHRAVSGFTVTGVIVQLFELGGVSSGTLSLDLKKGNSLDDSSMASMLTSTADIDLSLASDYDDAAGVVDPLEEEISAGDYLRIDVTKPSGLKSFRVLVYGNPI
jgi:hypothetical protein